MGEIKNDIIVKIEIDNAGRLHIKPKFEKFSLIYRSATEVHWDENKHSLYSPLPRDWQYFDWFKYILKVVESECFVKLHIDDNINWVNVPNDLKEKIFKYVNKV